MNGAGNFSSVQVDFHLTGTELAFVKFTTDPLKLEIQVSDVSLDFADYVGVHN